MIDWPIDCGDTKTNTGRWKVKHSYAHLFKDTFKTPLREIWVRVSSGRSLNPIVWKEFIESAELWQFFFDKIDELREDTLRDFLCTESPNEGLEIRTEVEEAYSVAPLTNALIPIGFDTEMIDSNDKNAHRHFFCKQFVKTVLIYFFAEVYDKNYFVIFDSHESLAINKSVVVWFVAPMNPSTQNQEQ